MSVSRRKSPSPAESSGLITAILTNSIGSASCLFNLEIPSSKSCRLIFSSFAARSPKV